MSVVNLSHWRGELRVQPYSSPSDHCGEYCSGLGSFLSFEASNRQQCPHKNASPLCSGLESLDDWPLGKWQEDSPFCHHEGGRIRKLVVTVTVIHSTQYHRTPSFPTPPKRQASKGRSIMQGL